jgi:hypothetical protein
MISKKPNTIKGIPTIAPMIVRLTITPTIINTSPNMIATNRPVIPMMKATNPQRALKGQRTHDIISSWFYLVPLRWLVARFHTPSGFLKEGSKERQHSLARDKATMGNTPV